MLLPKLAPSDVVFPLSTPRSSFSCNKSGCFPFTTGFCLEWKIVCGKQVNENMSEAFCCCGGRPLPLYACSVVVTYAHGDVSAPPRELLRVAGELRRVQEVSSGGAHALQATHSHVTPTKNTRCKTLCDTSA